MRYGAKWEIEDQTATTPEMKKHAASELAEWLEADGYSQNSPITWTREDAHLVAELDVIRVHAPLEDARPWESREAMVADLFDPIAA